MKKAIIFMNEQHSLLDEQKEILEGKYDDLEFMDIPSKGWNIDQMNEKIDEVLVKLGWEIENIGKIKHSLAPSDSINYDVVFVSPVPYMIKTLTEKSLTGDHNGNTYSRFNVKTFHNSNRDKKELDSGKIIFTISKTGWQLV